MRITIIMVGNEAEGNSVASVSAEVVSGAGYGQIDDCIATMRWLEKAALVAAGFDSGLVHDMTKDEE